MSNPTVTIGNSIPVPPDPKVVRTTFTKVVYDSQKFWVYGRNEFDPSYISFSPEGKGQEFYMFVALDNALGVGGSLPGEKPDFVSDTAWEGLKELPSGFITAVNSVMPKIIIPSEILVDNGIVTPQDRIIAAYKDPGGGGLQGLFNWKIYELNGVDIYGSGTDVFKYVQVSPYSGSQYISCKAKDDLESGNEMVIKLRNPGVDVSGYPPPQGSAHDWLADDSSNLVVGGAFVLMLNVVPSRPASADPKYVATKKWSVFLKFGEVEMVVDDSGSTEVTIGVGSISGQMNKATINLAEGKSKGGPPQQQHIYGKEPFVILIYPVWNGIVISSGIQDAHATVFSSSYYVPKLKEASVFKSPYSDGFDPNNPDDVEADVSLPYTDPNCVMVDFGNELTLTSNGCRFDAAYLPCFFSKECWFDEWRIQASDMPGTVLFEYDIYAIWTKNGTSSALVAPDISNSGVDGPIDGTYYSYTKWRLNQDHYNRIAGEIFGSILRVTETRDFPIKNGNGNFDVVFTADKKGDPGSAGTWDKYIQNISVTINLDGSSGQISVDKFGIAGQDSIADQSIGALTISATGGDGTVAGSIFQGLAMGIADNRSVGGASWSIPLIGLEKKMDDIALINVPFFDGDTLSTVGSFLCKYAGLIPDFSMADPNVRLSVTDDINAVRFDWKAGTTVRSALQDVMDDLLHSYIVRDGVVYFYQLDDTSGLPLTLGTDWKSNYPNTKVIIYDASPDFEDMRNEIAVLGIEQVNDGQGAKINDLPTFPRVALRSNISTTPDIPWAKTMVRPIPGYMQMADFDEYAAKLSSQFSVYELLGKTTIPGNANIKPYDTWGDMVIYGVTHNIDMSSKTWTTDLEFMKKTR